VKKQALSSTRKPKNVRKVGPGRSTEKNRCRSMTEEKLQQLPFSPNNVEELVERKAADDFVFFARQLVIPGANGRLLLEDAMRWYEEQGVEPFQRRFFEDIAPSLTAVRMGTDPPCRRFWLERTKKAGKDSDLAVCLLWLMAFPRRPTFCQVVAASRKQAGIIRHRAEDICFFNRWLAEKVRFTRAGMVSICGLAETRIEATDKATAHGDSPQLLILNELVHVTKWEAMESHYNNASGVPRGVMIVSTNAGYRGTRAEVWKQNALKKSDRWHVHVWDRCAPWLKEEDVEDARSANIPSEFDRLFSGRWVSGRGGSLTEESIDNVFRSYLRPMTGGEKGWEFVAGLDLGISHDHAGLLVLGLNGKENRLRVAWMKDWKPSLPNEKGRLEVDISLVKRSIVQMNHQFSPIWFGYDPAAGGSFLAQEMRDAGVRMTSVPFSGSSLDAMAKAFMMAVKSGKLESYESEVLRRDLGKFDIQPVLPERYRIKAISDEYGHADVGTALLICLPKAIELVGDLTPVPSQVFFHEEGEAWMEDQEVEKAKRSDPFLKDILEGVEEDEEEMRTKMSRDMGDFLDLM